jgi:hypothetical protein
MSTLWYYAHNEKKLGPFSQTQLKEMAAAGTILPTDTVVHVYRCLRKYP